MLQQRIAPAYFVGDEPAQRAVKELANPVARYAEMTRRLATARFEKPAGKVALYRDVVELRGLILARATSAGIVDHELDTFWEAVQAAASEKYRRKVEIYPLPTRAEIGDIVADTRRVRAFAGARR